MDGHGWSVSCTGCGGDILSVNLCDLASCTGSATHAWGYKLVARVVQTRDAMCLANDAFLTSVQFATTAVDDGREIIRFFGPIGDTCGDVTDCSLGCPVSPTSQSWSATDFAFGCNSNCGAVTGPTITMTYQ